MTSFSSNVIIYYNIGGKNYEKKLFLCISFLILLSSLCQAEVREIQDEFINGKRIQSVYQEKKFGESIYFNKLLSSSSDAYYIYCYNRVYNESNSYSNTPMEIKIDDEDVEYLEIKDINVRQFQKAIMIKCTTRNIDERLINRIRNAKRIAIKVYKNNNIPKIYILSENAINEWKQIINTKE